ncbi:MAG: hypothetical protein GF313_04540 [Caldithrix sp.]|nr:hypothetical protein [Caldithrix sp.]
MPMTSCDTVLSKLSSYIEGHLNAPQKDAIFEHLKECHTCNRIFSDVTNIKSFLHRSQKVSTSLDFDKNLRNRIITDGGAGKSKAPRSISFGLSGVAVAAILYFIVSTTFITGDNQANPGDSKMQMSGYEQQETPPNANSAPAIADEKNEGSVESKSDTLIQKKAFDSERINLIDQER